MDLKRRAMDGAVVISKRPRKHLVAVSGDMDVMIMVCHFVCFEVEE